MEKKTEQSRVSETEERIQGLLAERLFADEGKRAEIDQKIEKLKQTPEGERDQEKHDQIMREEK